MHWVTRDSGLHVRRVINRLNRVGMPPTKLFFFFFFVGKGGNASCTIAPECGCGGLHQGSPSWPKAFGQECPVSYPLKPPFAGVPAASRYVKLICDPLMGQTWSNFPQSSEFVVWNASHSSISMNSFSIGCVISLGTVLGPYWSLLSGLLSFILIGGSGSVY